MPYSTDKVKAYSTRVVVNTAKAMAESLNWKTDYKMFAVVSYADIVKQECNKGMNKNNVKSSDNVTKKSGTIKSASSHKVDNPVLTKYSRVIVPSKIIQLIVIGNPGIHKTYYRIHPSIIGSRCYRI